VRRTLLGLNFGRISRWLRQRHVQSGLTLGLVVAAPVLAFLTYIVVGPLDRGASSTTLQFILLLDLIYVLIVAALVMRQVARIIAERRARSAGSQLAVRLTGVFALSALVPIVLVAVFSVTLISIALDGLFSEPVGNVLQTSLTTAQAYEEEHTRELTRDGQGLAAFLNSARQDNLFMDDGEVRRVLGEVQTQIDRSLTEAFVIDGLGNIAARGAQSYEFYYERPSAADIARAQESGLALIQDLQNNEFRALIPLSAFRDRYLYVTRAVDGTVLSLLDDTTETVAQYDALSNERGRLLFQFVVRRAVVTACWPAGICVPARGRR
jgi:two-component system nitrogen regulation sensor histidine kinase NtrY